MLAASLAAASSQADYQCARLDLQTRCYDAVIHHHA
jgi:hypothetical protein